MERRHSLPRLGSSCKFVRQAQLPQEKKTDVCRATPVSGVGERLKNGPDFVNLTFPHIGPFIDLSITVDRYNQFYVGPQASLSWPPVGGAAGFINDKNHGTPWTQIPSARETSNFIAGLGGSMGGGIGLGVNVPSDLSQERQALQVMTPSVGVSYEFQWGTAKCP